MTESSSRGRREFKVVPGEAASAECQCGEYSTRSVRRMPRTLSPALPWTQSWTDARHASPVVRDFRSRAGGDALEQSHHPATSRNMLTPGSPSDPMAVASLLALLDDIASVLDDVSVLTKAARRRPRGPGRRSRAQRAAGCRGQGHRELPVCGQSRRVRSSTRRSWSGGARDQRHRPWAIVRCSCRGLFLCFEGFEKIWHLLVHRAQVDEHRRNCTRPSWIRCRPARSREGQDQGAIRTTSFFRRDHRHRARTVGTATSRACRGAVGIALLMTWVSTVSCGIVKIDDAGLYSSSAR